ncbi:MAG: bifunctional YncE family protein/alkaline phosphatase family protein [Bryobacteraceae bacterium]
MRLTVLMLLGAALFAQTKPQPVEGGYFLPNGWRITPAGKPIPTEDMVLNVVAAPDGKAVIATHGGFNPHGLVVIDTARGEAVQRIPLKSAWLGLAWNPAGDKLYVSGGNAQSRRDPSRAPIYVFGYKAGRLTEKPAATLEETAPLENIYWSGVAHHPKKALLYAANRGYSPNAGNVAVFDTATGKLVTRIQVQASPYDVVVSEDGSTVYVSNWGSDSISVIDTATNRVTATIEAGDSPNDLELGTDGRLFVSCANDNTVVVIDTAKRRAVEKITVSLFPHAPEGTTPNALHLDRATGTLFVANADNNAVAMVRVAEAGESEVIGFLPAGWYPSALTIVGGRESRLYVGNSKGMGSYSDERGPHSTLPPGEGGNGSVKSLQKGSVNIVSLANLRKQIGPWTKQVYANTPYNDDLLVRAKAPSAPSVVPSEVGAGSAIKHVIYIIKENRTYDQVFGDIAKGNGDARLTIFGKDITPNQHRLAEQFVLFDNLYCDGEVSVDGHSWSNSAYATDYNEKNWPPQYGGHSNRGGMSEAYVPAAGQMWDMAKKKGLTYRSYGEYATRASDGTTMEASPGVGGLLGHVAPKFKLPGMRDTDNARAFIEEFDEYERNYDSADADKRLPNYIVMSLPENHTRGASPGANTPRAMVANNDWAVGMVVDRVTHSRYWPETAIFVIEDDAQDGSDHVDARRTTGLVVSPYTKRKFLDNTLYTTSSMLRTMELLLGLPPMSQFDAAATPMYNAFSTKADLEPYTQVKPDLDLDEKNLVTAWGAKESLEMDFSDVDRAPMFALNEIIWKAMKGADSEMPLPVHRFWFPGQPPAAIR